MIEKTLYPLTDAESACRILEEGFKNGDDGCVWLCEHPKEALGEQEKGRLLKVILNIEQEELRIFAQSVEDEETFDETTGEWVPTPEDECEYAGVVFYAIPAETVNAIAHVVLMTPEDSHSLWL